MINFFVLSSMSHNRVTLHTVAIELYCLSTSSQLKNMHYCAVLCLSIGHYRKLASCSPKHNLIYLRQSLKNCISMHYKTLIKHV